MKIDSLTPDFIDDNKVKNLSNQRVYEESQIDQVAKDFESVFMELVLKSMRQSVDKSGFIDGGNAQEIYQNMLDSEYAKQLSHQGNSQISTAIKQQLMDKIKSQGASMTNSNDPQNLTAPKQQPPQTRQNLYQAESLQSNEKPFKINLKR